jgi:hypothetical protein
MGGLLEIPILTHLADLEVVVPQKETRLGCAAICTGKCSSCLLYLKSLLTLHLDVTYPDPVPAV